MTTPLEASGKPLFFNVKNQEQLSLSAPANRLGVSVRTLVRSLSAMQKEALVISSETGAIWRLASDEGPYLAGADIGPCPLSFLTTGMVSSYMNEILALAKLRQIDIRSIKLIQDNRYTMEGSAKDGSMIGGALPVQLEAIIDSDASDAELNKLVLDATFASPLNDLMVRSQPSLFTLSHNDQTIPVGQVTQLDQNPLPDPDPLFDLAQPDTPLVDEPFIKRLIPASEAHSAEALAANKNSSLNDNQSRELHVRGICTIREDGIKEIEQHLFNPKGSVFRFLSEEGPHLGGLGRAPDANSYISAGIAFCFMTQFGRYAKITKRSLQSYEIIQDTHFSKGGATGGTGNAGKADPVETHVYLKTDESDDVARMILDMSEQTCFLHAFCREKLKTKYRITRV